MPAFRFRIWVRNYPRGAQFVKKTFHQFFTTDTIQWFEERKLSLKTEEDGRMFPQSNSSQSVIDCLLQETKQYPVEIRLHHEIKNIDFETESNSFMLHFSNELKIMMPILSAWPAADIQNLRCLSGYFGADIPLKRRCHRYLHLICPAIP